MKINESKEFLDEFMMQWHKDQDYIIFGDSINVEYFIELLNDKIKIKYMVDNDQKKQGTLKKSISIFSPEKLREEKCNIKIIIASDSYYAISKQLCKMGFQEDTHFVSHSKVLSAWKWYYEKLVWLMRTDIMITTRCTLNCEHCNMLMPYYKLQYNKSFEEIQNDLDKYFNIVDFVVTFQIVGGEIFLHPQLYKILNYICSKYSGKIHNILIVTNGTIIPSSEILDICSNFNVAFSISDYTDNVNYRVKITRLAELLNRKRIKFRITKSDWVDFGSPLISKNLSEEQLITYFNKCRAPFRGLGNGRVYYCHLNYSAVCAGIVQENENDYFDLNIENDKKELCSLELLKFDMGYTKLGYITFCQNCNGCGAMNNRNVKSGIQKSKEINS